MLKQALADLRLLPILLEALWGRWPILMVVTQIGSQGLWLAKTLAVPSHRGLGLHSLGGESCLMDGQMTFMISSHPLGKGTPAVTLEELISMCRHGRCQ